MAQNDYYEILGVDRKATQKEIKETYRKLAFQYHPDRNKENPEASSRMKEINESYAVLSDRKKRSEYDGLRERFGPSAYGQFRQSYSEQDIFRGSDINQVFEEITRAFGFRGFEDIFRESYGSRFQTYEFRRPGFFGKGFVFKTPYGRGSNYDTRLPVDGGLGRLVKLGLKKIWGMELPEKGKDWHDVITLSPQLARGGGRIMYIHRRRSNELVVRIPAGIRAGQVIRLRGMGGGGKGGGEAGDLYIKVRIRGALLQKIRDFVKRLLGTKISYS